MLVELKLPILISEQSKINRVDEPIINGVYLKKGVFFDKEEISLFDKGKKLPLQTEVLAKWGDGSIKWLLLDFKASVKAGKKKGFYLKKTKSSKKKNIVLNNLDLFLKSIKINVVDSNGRGYDCIFSDYIVETKGELRTTIKYNGKFKDEKDVLFGAIARFSFYSDSKLVKLDFTVKNSRACEHSGGFWDLGDKGSVFFKDLSLRIDSKKESDVFFKENVKKKLKKISDVEVYQDSSGNKNWKSKTHVDKTNKVPLSFKGYKVFSSGKEVSKGDHALPSILLKNKEFSLSVAIKDFWQNFPKALEADKNGLTIRLFPRQSDYLHELQGGEQKTHTIYLDYSGKDLDWVQDPLRIIQDRKFISDKRYQRLIDVFLRDFDKKNLEIDEFGWRNFGDIYADHESVNKKSISHYNNQYDVVNGALLQFFKSGDLKWFKIADNMAKHVRDIDIYHTTKDKNTYNGGMFWHTFHYMDAATSSHRSYSKLGKSTMDKFNYGSGGGPSNEHNYATGLMNHYFLTGDMISKESVLSLGNWVIDMDDGSKSVLKFFNHKSTGKASQSESVYYHGPGRGSGNSLNILLDCYEITEKNKYLIKAEKLIKRCIHPNEDISKNNLKDIEHRWFYLVFLQALGRYLDLKQKETNYDYYIFEYARKSLLHYAFWMLKNEVPYKDVLDQVDIPTETWPAQDIRKAVVFDYAYRCSKENIFKLKSKFFFDRCIQDLNTFKTKTFTRPLAILMHYGAREEKDEIKVVDKKFKFGKRKKFKPQGYLLFKLRDFVNKFR